MEIFLDKNENPFEMPASLKKIIVERLAALPFNRYPDPGYRSLREKIGLFCGFPADSIVPGNGGDEVLLMAFSAFTKPGDTVLAFTPTFSEYPRLADLFHVRFSTVAADLSGDEPFFDFPLFLERARREKPSLILLDTPNNPTGKRLPDEFLEQVLSSCPAMTIIDEAYGEFASGTFLERCRKKGLPENALILKTFSKAFGLAGIRLGYAVCGGNAAGNLNAVKSLFNVNVLTCTIAETILDHPAAALDGSVEIQRTRDWFVGAVNGLRGWRAFPGEGNFVLVRGRPSKEAIRKAAEERGISLKYPALDGVSEDWCWIRVTVGTKAEMGCVLEFLAGFPQS